MQWTKALSDRVDAVVLTGARRLWSDQEEKRHRCEQGGVVTYNVSNANVAWRVCNFKPGSTGGPGYDTVPPHCRGTRSCAVPERGPGDIVIGEFHTHGPARDPDTGRLQPWVTLLAPSFEDLYQLGLAASDGQFDRLYVLAPEGLYTAIAGKRFVRGISADVAGFYARIGLPHVRCRRPSANRVDAGVEPLLHRLLNETPSVYSHLINHRGLNARQRIDAYTEFLSRRIGVSLLFQAWDPNLPLREATEADWNVRTETQRGQRAFEGKGTSRHGKRRRRTSR